MIVLLSELHSFDDFHTQQGKTYRVTSSRHVILGEERNYASSSIYIGNQLKEQSSGIAETLILRKLESTDIQTNLGAIPIAGFYASTSFFEVFSFKLIKGNPETALEEPDAIVITESSSRKLFKDDDPIGRLITVNPNGNNITAVVSGVVEDPPMNSHIQFEALISLNTFYQDQLDPDAILNNPEDIFYNYVYLVLNSHIHREAVELTIDKLMADFNGDTESPITHRLQPLDTIVTGNFYHNAVGPSFENHKILIMIGLTMMVLLSACFNYTNLSIARALRRAKEVGIRKVTGATGWQVFEQFTLEAVVLAVVALIVGLGLFLIIRPEFLNLPNPTAKGYEMFLLDIELYHLLYFLLFAVIVGLVAGFLPALFLSKLSAQVVLKDASKIRLFSGIRLRGALLVFQLAMSMGLITSAILVYKQYQFTLQYDLGYETEQIINVKVKGQYAQQLKHEYTKLAEVVEASCSSIMLGTGNGSIGIVHAEDRSNSIRFLLNHVDQHYLGMHNFEILAGSGMLPQQNNDQAPRHIIVNQEFLKSLDLGSPVDAIGKVIWFNNHQLTIHGVVKDFINASLTMDLFGAFAFVVPDSLNRFQYVGVKIQGSNILHTMDELEAAYKKIDPVHPFEASFYDDSIAETYQHHKATYTVISFLAFLAISISALGLLGMAVFTVETRLKEISMRRVLGADLANLMFILSKGFLKILIAAGVIAIPLSLYIVNKKILNEFIYRIEIGLIDVLSGFVVVFVLGILTVCWQIYSTSVRNPADVLRAE